jgi:hypothetical protein
MMNKIILLFLQNISESEKKGRENQTSLYRVRYNKQSMSCSFIADIIKRDDIFFEG